MRSAAAILLLPLVLNASEPIRVENDGVMHFNTKGASVRCHGKTSIFHSEFELHSTGQLVQFYGARLKVSDKEQRPRKIEVHTQPNSIIAIGEVKVTLKDANPHRSIRCKKAVYIHETGHWLIDGKAWPEEHPVTVTGNGG
jgi:hypothetical protein